MDGVGQLPEGDGGRDEGRGRGHECNRPASGSSRTNLQTGTRHSSHKELDIINIHASPSGDSWSFNGTGSASPNSQHGCDLANEEDYVVGEAFDCENDWDDCGMSSSED